MTDEQGHAVRDLRQNQFTILDDGKPPRLILNFEPQSVVPLRLALLIHAGGQDAGRLDAEKRAAVDFIRHAIRPQADQAFVLGFSEVPDVAQDFTGDRDKLAAGVGNIRAGRGHALWDAVYFACRDKLMSQAESTLVRRVMVLIADGADKDSRVRPEEALEMAQRAQVTVYAISSTAGDDDLQALTDATGGRARSPKKQNDLAGAFAEIAAELRTQYLVTYATADFSADGRFHSISVVAENKKLRVRAPKGYFAPKR